jgi:hypothetical protein
MGQRLQLLVGESATRTFYAQYREHPVEVTECRTCGHPWFSHFIRDDKTTGCVALLPTNPVVEGDQEPCPCAHVRWRTPPGAGSQRNV